MCGHEHPILPGSAASAPSSSQPALRLWFRATRPGRTATSERLPLLSLFSAFQRFSVSEFASDCKTDPFFCPRSVEADVHHHIDKQLAPQFPEDLFRRRLEPDCVHGLASGVFCPFTALLCHNFLAGQMSLPVELESDGYQNLARVPGTEERRGDGLKYQGARLRSVDVERGKLSLRDPNLAGKIDGQRRDKQNDEACRKRRGHGDWGCPACI